MTGQSFVQIAADSTGKKLDTWIVLGSGGAEVHREAFILAFPDASIGSATATSFGGFTALHVSPIVSSGVSATIVGQPIQVLNLTSVGTIQVIPIASAGVFAQQAGTWTVQQGGAPWSVTFPSAQQITFTNSVGTHPVTIEGQPISVSQSGTWNINNLTAITSSVGVSATLVGLKTSGDNSDDVAVETSDILKVGARLYGFDSTGWDRIRAIPLNTSIGFAATFPGVLAIASLLALEPGIASRQLRMRASPGDGMTLTDVLETQTGLLGFNGSTWDRIRTVGTGSLKVAQTDSGGRVIEPLSAEINATETGNIIIAAPGSGKTAVVTGYVLVAKNDVTARWDTGSAPNRFASGPMTLASSSGVSFNAGFPMIAFRGKVNTALSLNLSSAVSVGGHVSYYIEG